MTSGDVLTLLLGGGAVATISALFKGVQALQSGARAREKDTVNDLVRQRKEAWDDRDKAIDERDYWRNWAGTVEFHARQSGVTLPNRPAEPVHAEPVSE
jgi:hypothetical protein